VFFTTRHQNAAGRVGDKPAGGVRIAQHAVVASISCVWLDAALPKEAALALRTLGRLVPGGVQPAELDPENETDG
jgi:hypothetical protein